MINLSTGEVPALTANMNDIILESDGKIWIQSDVSDPDPNDGYCTRGTMAITLNKREILGFVDIGFPDESGVCLDLRPS